MSGELSRAEANERIDEFYERTKAMEGTAVQEGSPWNTHVNADQARHYLNGISDINPRWQPRGPGDEVHPTYLTSVVYPLLHGEPMDVPLSSLIAGIEYEWDEPLHLGDGLDGTAVVKDVFEKGDPEEKRYIFIISEVTYQRNGREVGRAEGTMIRATQLGDELLSDRDVKAYDESELETLKSAYDAEIERLETVPETPEVADLEVGDPLPTVVRGPLTISDMVCWNAARGPTYGAGIINYQERQGAPHNTVTNPKTGWLQKTSHQHEDIWLCEQRGMPLPFGNGVMMYAWTTPLVTNWMGADGHLESHSGTLKAPYFYGDTLTIDGEISAITEDAGTPEVTIEWAAVDPYDEPVLEGESVVSLPER